MIIKNYQQFYELIKHDNLPVKTELLNCITSVIKTCACKKELKAKRSDQCNQIYIEWIKNNASKYKQYWKQKTNEKFISFLHSQTYMIIKINLEN